MLNNHCTSKDLAIALREAGYPQQNALFYWSVPKPECADNEEERLALANDCEVQLCHKWTDWGDKFDRIAAPLASEMLEELPNELNIPYKNGRKRKQDHYLYLRKLSDGWRIRYYANKYNDNPTAHDQSLPDACANLWLHLKSAGLLKEV